MKVLFFVIISFYILSTQAVANDFPNRPVTLLLGFERGGTMYTLAETVAEVLSDKLGQPVNIEARPGHGGGTAAAMLANSNSEGYILLLTPSFAITDYPIRLQASYEIEDFIFIGSVLADQHALVTSHHATYSSWEEFISFAQQQGEIRYASQNLTDRLIIQEIAKQEGFSVRIIPVSGGAGMTPLVLSGDVDLAFSGGTHARFTDSGEMRVLATTGSERLVHYPNVPTLQELGYILRIQSVSLIAAPKNTPNYQIEKLTIALEAMMDDPRFINVTEYVIRQPRLFIKGEELRASLQLQQLNIMRLMSNHMNND
ncbi:MAG: tripartite tricarboxylate transporter substrate binding protein [Oceanospirillales bacterium]|nr:MAG: tripartite tricarboxylate transporter substrate binding protein [Oceanospirillales bacterium]